jgi:hypothetical protein
MIYTNKLYVARRAKEKRVWCRNCKMKQRACPREYSNCSWKLEHSLLKQLRYFLVNFKFSCFFVSGQCLFIEEVFCLCFLSVFYIAIGLIIYYCDLTAAAHQVMALKILKKLAQQLLIQILTLLPTV